MGSPSLAVPALRLDEHTWLAEQDGMTSRRAMSQANGPYRSAVPASIAGLELALPGALAADVEEAAAALGRFDLYARSVLGPQSPALGPMASILLRTESASSSQIENLTVGARQLALAEIGQASAQNADEVVANVRAMEAALAVSGPLAEDDVLGMHRVLLAGQARWGAHAGRYRDGLVWVGTSRVTPRGASYVAPQAELVPAAMRDLVAFMARDDLPVLVQAAIAHAQLETIHPFADGNGRTGRAVVHALLHGKGLLTSTTAPVSAGLLRETERYFDALTAFRRGDAAPIVERFCEASMFAAGSGVRLVDSLHARVEASEKRLDAAGLRRDAAARRVLPYLVGNPAVDAAFLVARLRLAPATARRALDDLTDAGVLVERSGKRRNRVWQHPGILAELDAYAQAVRRQ
ncbi:Fic family protein [Luteimicrobium sp. DT211]|uniref:Fic family protein n=1 Tax=Luteimicrobium sp. DT211 TaxID=3393412 RepID=UPI003CFBBC40